MNHKVYLAIATAVFCSFVAVSCLPLVDYVVETFDTDAALNHLDVDADKGDVQALVVTTENTSYYGEGFLQLNCSEVSGGLTIESIRQESGSLDSVLLAKTVSFWYNIDSTKQFTFELTFSVFDRTWCKTKNCTANKSIETWENTVTVVDDEEGWHEASFSLNTTLWKRSAGFNDGVLDLRSVRGWSISIDVGQIAFSGRISVDHVAYHGDSDMIGAAMFAGSWTEAEANSIIRRDIFNSSVSWTSTSQVLDKSGSLDINYLVEQRAVWGGFVGYWMYAPPGAYFNLSRVDTISFDYRILSPASVPGRVHLRLILSDRSDCTLCNDANLEHYYSFHNVLDSPNMISASTRSVELVGDEETSSPFTLTGWVGGSGNRRLDKSWVNGMGFEININSQGEIGSQVQGSIRIGGLRAHQDVNSMHSGVELPFIVEPDIILLTQNDNNLKHWEFKTFVDCKAECMASPRCNFAFSSGFGLDCYHADDLDANSIALKTSSHQRDSAELVWKNTQENRGDFCTVCNCIESFLMVDCRGQNLILPPRTFTQQWKPKILDLRDNPRLHILGRHSLQAFHSLVELRVSKELLFLSQVGLATDQLERIVFGLSSDPGNSGLINAIATKSSQFGSVCCSRGRTWIFESQMLTWCNMEIDTPGIDCAFENFTQYWGDYLDRLTPSSLFLSEASETPEKCAEVCSMRLGCSYFSFDNRLRRADPICWHYSDIEYSATQCCHPEDYNDVQQRIPGWISGRVARTRSQVDGARVLVEPVSGITLDHSSNFLAHIYVRLGAMPTRGAVWVRPTVPDNLKFQVTFEPAIVVLYDNTTSSRMSVSGLFSEIESLSEVETILVTLDISACDRAFQSFTSSENPIVSIRAIPSRRGFWPTISAVASILAVFGSACCVLLFFYKKQADMLWLISPQDLEFDSPPIILGRGTFGVVTKATYRGTAVAIKRALPETSVGKTTQALCRSSGQFNAQFFAHPQSLNESEPRVGVGLLTMNGDMAQINSVEPNRRAYWENIFNFSKSSSGALRTSFIREMRLLSSMRHPCITTVLGAVLERSSKETLLVMGATHSCFLLGIC